MTATAPEPLAPKSAWLYFKRSLRLRCPVCGVSPLFKPVSQIRTVLDWFVTLPGCPRCDYVYDQEPGYFMLALWSFDYGAAALFDGHAARSDSLVGREFGVGHLDHHAFQGDVQLIRGDHGQCRAQPLSDLHLAAEHPDSPVAVHPNPTIQLRTLGDGRRQAHRSPRRRLAASSMACTMRG